MSHYDDYERDDRCDDEAAEGRRWDSAMDRAALHGVPFDPVLEGLIEEETEEVEA
jgi:hypothetical protein